MDYCDVMKEQSYEKTSVYDMVYLALEELVRDYDISERVVTWYEDDTDEVCRIRVVRQSLTDPPARWMIVNDNPYEDPLSVFMFADLTSILDHVRRIYHDVYIQ